MAAQGPGLPPSQDEDMSNIKMNEEERDEIVTRLKQELNRKEGLSAESRRKEYACGDRWRGVNELDTWSQHPASTSTTHQTDAHPLRRFNGDLNDRVSLIWEDITALEVDAIVNAAKESLLGGSGVDGAIHKAAGPLLRDECSLKGGCKTGHVTVTDGYRLPARRVIHAVGPQTENPDLLRQTYQRCLETMLAHDLRTIAIPCISTGIYGYAKAKAAPIAVDTVREFLQDNWGLVDRVIFCVFSESDLNRYREALRIYFPLGNPSATDSETEDLVANTTAKTETSEISSITPPQYQPVFSQQSVAETSTTILEAGNPVVSLPARMKEEPASVHEEETEEVRSLTEKYRFLRQDARQALKDFVLALEDVPPNRKLLKRLRLMLNVRVTDLNNQRENLSGLADCVSIDDDLDDFTHRVEIARADFYSQFPRAYSQAPSSEMTSTVLSLAPSHEEKVLWSAHIRLAQDIAEEQLDKEAREKLETLDQEKRDKERREEAERLEEDRLASERTRQRQDEIARKKEEARLAEEEAKRVARLAEEEAKRVAKIKTEEAEELRIKLERQEEDEAKAKASRERIEKAKKEEEERIRKRDEEAIQRTLDRKKERMRLEGEIELAHRIIGMQERAERMPDLPKVDRMGEFLEDVAASQEGCSDRQNEKEESRQQSGALAPRKQHTLAAPPRAAFAGISKGHHQTLPSVKEEPDTPTQKAPTREVKVPIPFPPGSSLRDPSPQIAHQFLPRNPPLTPANARPWAQNAKTPVVSRPDVRQKERTEPETWRREEGKLLRPSYMEGTGRVIASTVPAPIISMTPTAHISTIPTAYTSVATSTWNHETQEPGPRPSRGEIRYTFPVRDPFPPAPNPSHEPTHLNPSLQSRRDPTTEPFEYYGGGSVSARSDSSEDLDSVRGSSVGTQTERRAPGEERCNTTQSNEASQLAKALADAISLNRLPQQEPQVFYGDPIAYPPWRTSFDLLVGRQSISPDEKLMYLRKYLGGAAKEPLEGLFLMGGEAAYDKALEMLKERFGHPVTVSGAFLTRFNNWPVVRNNDAEGLRKLSDFMQQCIIATTMVGNLELLDSPTHQRTLTLKMPDWLQRGWLEKSVEFLRKNHSYPPFSKLAEFVKKRSDIANDPMFSLSNKNSTSTGDRTPPPPRSQRPGSSFATVDPRDMKFPIPKGTPERYQQPLPAKERGPPCFLCETHAHTLLSCRRFLSFDPSTRKNFLFEKNLCFSCALTNQHLSRDCPSRPQCRTCGAPHLTELHDAPRLNIPPRNWSADHNRRPPQPTAPPQPPNSNFLPPSIPVNTPPPGRHPYPSNADPSSRPPQDARLLIPPPNGQGPPLAGGYAEGKRESPKGNFSGSTCQAGRRLGGMTSMVVPVMISSTDDPQTEIKTYALLDTMSSITFVTDSLAERLKTKSESTALRLNTMTAHNLSVPCKKVCGLQIRPMHSRHQHPLSEVFSTNNLTLNPDNVPTKKTTEGHAHLEKLSQHLSDYDPTCEAGVLIGYDHSDLLMPLDVVQGQPFAVRTVLGWSIVGPVDPPQNAMDVRYTSYVSKAASSPPGHEPVYNVYRTGAVEIPAVDVLRLMERDFVETETGIKSQEDIRFMEIIGTQIHRNSEGHYQMPLPFKNDPPQMPDNREAARKRTLGLLRRFDKDAAHKARYQAFMDDIITSGHAELVPEDQIGGSTRWYIPHHGVYSEKKPDKVRVVFDCSASYQGACLNDELLQGPDLINSLVGVLCRFRQGKIAFSCDVQKMFHQFHVLPEHRDYLRFLWWEDGDTRKPLRDYRMRVHIFGAVSSPGCANFALQQVGRDNEHVNREAAQFLQHDFYVDDGLHASDDVDTAANLLNHATQICEKSKLHLHKIVSNSPELLLRFPEADRSPHQVQQIAQIDETTAVERILGLQWDTKEDAFTFTPQIQPKPETRRGILSTVASIYDPLGLISPLVLQGKLILQQACGEKLDWDVDLTDNLQTKWRVWMSDLTHLSEIQIPRSFYPRDFQPLTAIELHHFSDASEIGYGQCSYLRVLDNRDHVHCSLVMSKSRVAPLKTVTVPRLELQGAALSVKIAKYLDTEMKLNNLKHHFWTDSKIVLAYLANESRRFHVFVANRVSQILDFSSVGQWHHVISEDNPADHASRGRGVGELNLSSWFRGPKFLWNTELPMERQPIEIDETEMEIKTCRATHTPSNFAQRFTRYSNKRSLVRGIACLLRVLRRKTKKTPWTLLESLQKAETQVLRHIQAEAFQTLTPVMKKKFESLDAIQDTTGCWRVGGRLRNSRDEKLSHPLILPRDSHVTELWVRDTHEKLGHAGRTAVIQEMRSQGFHVMGTRHVIRRVAQACITCKKLYAGPEGQRMADLPQDRITQAPPFSYCGIDCFGPFVVKDGRRHIKRYGLIVTCLAMRAIHLEVLDDMSTDAFLSSIRNVIAIRGNIRRLRSDRGTNFVGAKRELRECWKKMDHDKVTRVLAQQETEWILNTPTASHMGGVWERQIRSVRSVLSGLTKKSDARLTTSSLRTLFYEVMAIVNSRPLSVESLEDPLGPLPLTPNHILTTKSSGVLPPPGVFEAADLVARKAWRRVQFLADEFWNRWRKDFLATLQTRRKWRRRQQNLVKGDVVILRDEGLCRSDWRLALVEKTYPGDDGLVRRCQVSTAEPGQSYGRRGGTVARSTYDRPVHKLTLLVRAEPAAQ